MRELNNIIYDQIRIMLFFKVFQIFFFNEECSVWSGAIPKGICIGKIKQSNKWKYTRFIQPRYEVPMNYAGHKIGAGMS